MNERLKELAKQAELLPLWVCVNEPTGSQMIKPIDQDIIKRFAELVRQDEREACVKIALKYEPIERQSYVTYAADEIRARGNRTKTSKDICGND